MPDPYDLFISGGTLVDGTGAPPRPGDLGIRDGRIVAVGHAPGPGAAHRRRPRAGRRPRLRRHPHALRRPGLLGPHAHASRRGTASRRVVIGNCGFGIAPTRPADRDLILRTLENVEGMSIDALRTGLGADWRFETFPEFLDAIERARHGDQRRRAGRPHAGPALRDGRGGDGARGDRGRDRAHARARRATRSPPARSASRPRSRRRTSATRAARCRAARPPSPRSRRSPGRSARPARRHAGDDRPRSLPRTSSRTSRSATGQPVSWTALLARHARPDGPPRRPRAAREAAERGRARDPAGGVPPAHASSSS